jgi:hypothetical protein
MANADYKVCTPYTRRGGSVKIRTNIIVGKEPGISAEFGWFSRRRWEGLSLSIGCPLDSGIIILLGVTFLKFSFTVLYIKPCLD